ncbi:hypothetical protein QFZ37_001094 [Chryseobacterium ginsenosidimutans]|uniref:hypothetical protein n=1 Tax=Chryseobacterium ginsenosidimutans TaxID=687846 RepID=UPI00278280EB|nr:hypothetical protein [Chryseobacterium ginsenosidimutans]MDQ0592725.1 hypothetical protein [Chryseobacterium ginsenosidimutans]
MKTISKIILTANNGVFKALIQEIVHNKELEEFKIIFSANIVETQIIITKKNRAKVSAEDWTELLQFLKGKQKIWFFTKVVE